MAQPAFPQQHQPGPGSTVTKLELFRRAICARRGGHHQRQARVFKLDRARALAERRHKACRKPRCADGYGPSVPRPGAGSPTSCRAATGAPDRTRSPCRKRHMRLDQPRDLGERRIALRQIVERRIAGVAFVSAIAAPARPASSSRDSVAIECASSPSSFSSPTSAS